MPPRPDIYGLGGNTFSRLLCQGRSPHAAIRSEGILQLFICFCHIFKAHVVCLIQGSGNLIAVALRNSELVVLKLPGARFLEAVLFKSKLVSAVIIYIQGGLAAFK